MKTVIENGTKKYLATNNGEIYKVYKMNNGKIAVEGKSGTQMRSKSEMKGFDYVMEQWGVYAMPTKEARIFAGKKPELVAWFSNQNDAYDYIDAGGNYYDELIDGYAVRLVI